MNEHYWRPLAECGDLPEGEYIAFWNEDENSLRPVEVVRVMDRDYLPSPPSHVLYLGASPVTLPSTPKEPE